LRVLTRSGYRSRWWPEAGSCLRTCEPDSTEGPSGAVANPLCHPGVLENGDAFGI